MMLSAIILAGILASLSALHVYWAFGGKWGSRAVIPSKIESQKPLFKAPTLATLLVAFSLLMAALIVLSKANILTSLLPAWMAHIGVWLLAVVFMLRAIGDFRYVGFFKSIHHTSFTRMDSRVYSPLCLLLALLAMQLAVS